MKTPRFLSTLLAVFALLSACGSDQASTNPTTTQGGSPTTVITTAPTTSPVTTTTAPSPTTSTAVVLEQPAIWPAPDVVFATPQAAAADFVAKVLQGKGELGEFVPGDGRSGEVEVRSPGEVQGTNGVARGLLFLRQLGPHDSWFILAIGNTFASIASPAQGANVPAAPLTVEGAARGYEATVHVEAFAAGDAGAVLDSQLVQAGKLGGAEPFGVTLDLSEATPGQTVAILVRGDAGLETDPGELGAIAVVVNGST